MIKLYDKVKLKDGHEAEVIDILGDGKCFVCDVYGEEFDAGVEMQLVMLDEIYTGGNRDI